MKIFHVTLVGVNALNGERLWLTAAFIAAIVIVRYALNWAVRALRAVPGSERARFWIHQAVNLASIAFIIVAIISIWVGPHSNLATVGGLIGAGIAFALQQFIIAIAGYFVILRGKHYSVGDRIMIGDVRGEVIALDLIQTTVLEMGQPASIESEASPATWVWARQYTGRIVAVSNGTIFTQPVYNYSRDFRFIWEEIRVGVGYNDKYERAEQILLETARRHGAEREAESEDARGTLREKYDLQLGDRAPRVYYRMTDNWVELALRFIVPDRRIREIKDAMYREILAAFKAEGISVASGTYDIVGFPPIRIASLPVQPPPAPEAERKP